MDEIRMYTMMTEPMCIMCGKAFRKELNEERTLLVLGCDCTRQRVLLARQWFLVEGMGDALDQTILLNLVGFLGETARRENKTEGDEVRRIWEDIFGKIDISEEDRDELIGKLRVWKLVDDM